jgi:hypothetical protein
MFERQSSPGQCHAGRSAVPECGDLLDEGLPRNLNIREELDVDQRLDIFVKGQHKQKQRLVLQCCQCFTTRP